MDGPGGGYTVTFKGDLINNGYIKLANKLIQGNLINNGIWEDVGYTSLQSTNNQEVRIVSNHSINGTIDFYSGFTGIEYYWYKDGIYYGQGNYIRFQNPDSTKFGVYLCKTVISQGDTASRSITFHKGTITEVELLNVSPSGFALYQNYPNPFNPSTKISWQSPVGSWQTIKLYDLLGREIETIVEGYYEAGSHSTLYNVNSSSSSGVYFYQLTSQNFSQTKKMLIIK
jgi:hypothetical protein